MNSQRPDERAATVILPNEMLNLASRTSRILLAILIELHENQAPQRAPEEESDDE